MLVNDKLDKQVFQRAMSEIKPNGLGIHYGVDDNKIKGVNHFPVFSDYSGVHLLTNPSAEEFIYTKPVGNKYTVGIPSHHVPPSLHSLYDFDADKKVPPPGTRDSRLRGIGNSLYGLPDLTINLKNYAAEEAGVVGITSTQMMRKNWQNDQLPDGLEEIINRGSRIVDVEAGESKWGENLIEFESKAESKGDALGGWAVPDFEESKEWANRPKAESKSESKSESKGESKGSKSHARVMAQPAFGSSSPKQGEERGLELRPLGQIVNERQLSKEKKFRSPRAPAQSPPSPPTPRKDDSDGDELPLDLQKIVIQLSAKPNDDVVSKAQFDQINELLVQQGKPKLHGRVTKTAQNIVKKINISLVGEESAKKKVWEMMGIK